MKLFHAHAYFKADDLREADHLARLARTEDYFKFVKLYEKPIGPHPTGMVELHFDEPAHNSAVKWIEAHRGPMSVLVHEETGDDVRDHTEGIQWLGPKVSLDFGFFELIKSRPDLRVHKP